MVFAVFPYPRSGVGTEAGYEVTARFNSVDGLGVGDDVRIGGIRAGSVPEQTLETTFDRALARKSIDSEVALTEDTTAASSGDDDGKME